MSMRVKSAHLTKLGGDTTTKHFVSIVVRVSEDAIGLLKSIKSLMSKTGYDYYEIIILYSSFNSDNVITNCEQFNNISMFKVVKCDIPLDLLNDALYFNTAAEICAGKYIFFVNEGVTVLYEHWLETWMEVLSNFTDVGIGGGTSFVTDKDGNTMYQTAEEFIGNNADITDCGAAGLPGEFQEIAWHFAEYDVYNVSSVTKGLFAAEREMFRGLGGFDVNFPDFFYLTDLCLRSRNANRQNILYKKSEVTYTAANEAQKEAETEKYDRELNLFKEKWSRHLKETDPFLNPNLSLIYYKKYGCPFKII
jgi:hypothetical protein